MDLSKYTHIIVGAGIFGATVAERLANQNNKSNPNQATDTKTANQNHILVVDRRPHLAGNIYSYTDPETKIEVHEYGSHIFHTESDEVWDYLNQFTKFNDYTHFVNTRHAGKLYPIPINLDTINLLYEKDFDAATAEEFVKETAEKDAKAKNIETPQNFEEQGIKLVGEKLYEAFLKNYTKKQWHTDPKNLPASLLKRIPVRFSHDNRYFPNAKHQGIPVDGYTKMIEKMLAAKNIDIQLNTSFRDIEPHLKDQVVIYCGMVDELLDYQLGDLPYRSLRFETEKSTSSLGQAVVNEADLDVAYTRTHDYKYYQSHQPDVVNQDASILCREFPADYERGAEAYYPVNNDESQALYEKYVALAKEKYPNLILGGRLGAYRYWDMDQAVANALDLAKTLI